MEISSERPHLMLVTDRHRGNRPLLDAIDAAVSGGVTVVQIREKDLPASDRFQLAARVADMCKDRAAVVVNSDAAAAIHLGIGLHLPENAPEAGPDLRANLSPGSLVGRSTHSASFHTTFDLDYVLLGHIFATDSKPGLRPLGLESLTKTTKQSTIPVWAIGGIDADNVGDVLLAGARGVAVIGAILDADDPYLAAQRLRFAIDIAAKPPA